MDGFIKVLKEINKDKEIYEHIDESTGVYKFVPGEIYLFTYNSYDKTIEESKKQIEKNKENGGGNVYAVPNEEGLKYLREKAKEIGARGREKIKNMLSSDLSDLWVLKLSEKNRDTEHYNKFKEFMETNNKKIGEAKKHIQEEINKMLDSLGYSKLGDFEANFETKFFRNYLFGNPEKAKLMDNYIPAPQDGMKNDIYAIYVGEKVNNTTGTILPLWFKLNPTNMSKDFFENYSDKLITLDNPVGD